MAPRDTARKSGGPEDSARRAALSLLAGVLAEKQTIADQLTGPEIAALSAPDRARAQRLALTVLRNLGRADTVLKPLLRKAPPDDILLLLRLAVVEMLMDRAAAHGVVNSAVALTRAAGPRAEPFTGMVNAVLRRVAETPPEVFAALPPPPLAPWLRRRLIEAWGKPAVQAIEAVQVNQPPVDLTPKSGDGTALSVALGGTALPTGSLRLASAGRLTELPGYAEGNWWVQDAAAAVAARALHVAPGERVADLCAAPGGKTLQLAASGAKVTAVDLSDQRLDRLRQNLTRCQLQAEVVAADVLSWDGGPFDAVLLDAPCSATGTIRRHPELPLIRDGGMLAGLAATQAALLDRAIALTRPGGRIVYCTCSLLPAEGESQLTAVLERHPGLVVDAAALNLPGIASDWIGPEGGLRLRPDYWSDIGGMDGFFIAAMRKPD